MIYFKKKKLEDLTRKIDDCSHYENRWWEKRLNIWANWPHDTNLPLPSARTEELVTSILYLLDEIFFLN